MARVWGPGGALLMLALVGPVRGQEADAVASRVEEARKDYVTACETIRTTAAKRLQAARAAADKAGRSREVELYERDRERLFGSGQLPMSVPTADLRQARELARKKVEAAYTKAAADYQKQKHPEKVRELEASFQRWKEGLAGAEPVDLMIAEDAEHGASPVWRYTTNVPSGNWYQPGFDDSTWHEGPAGFGVRGTARAIVRTEWNTGQIWLRRTFVLPSTARPGLPTLRVHHDEGVQVFLNGVLVWQTKPGAYEQSYKDVAAPLLLRALRPGNNVLAVTCRNGGGLQYVDVGIVDRRPN